MGPEGNIEADIIELHTGVDQTPLWLEISLDHVNQSKNINDQLRAAVDENLTSNIGQLLQEELKAGMQAVACSCIAVDAFYANVKGLISIPENTIRAWKRNGTARNRQISEVLRLAFPMSARRAAFVRKAIQQNFSWRDQAVHPSSKQMPPALHKTLNRVTDRRFALFCHYNAREIARLSFVIINWASKNPPSNKHENLKKYCEILSTRISHLESEWNERFGEIPEETDTKLSPKSGSSKQ